LASFVPDVPPVSGTGISDEWAQRFLDLLWPYMWKAMELALALLVLVVLIRMLWRGTVNTSRALEEENRNFAPCESVPVFDSEDDPMCCLDEDGEEVEV
jgi:hypothetical protein